MHKQKQAFTLVELIVVITILAILGTISFISLQGYSESARDSVRISDLNNISKGLELTLLKGSKVPIPNDKVDITASGTIISYQGYAGAGVLSLIGISGGGKDPVDDNYYTYTTDTSLSKYQIMGFLENDLEISLLNSTFSADYSSRSPIVKGDQLGILLLSGSLVPIQETGTGVDIVNTSNSYRAYLGNNDIINGNGTKLKMIKSSVLYGNLSSCKKILSKNKSLENKDGVYTISRSGTGSIEVYCDMTTDGGGWTLFSYKGGSLVGDNATSGYSNYGSADKSGYGTFNITNKNFSGIMAYQFDLNNYILYDNMDINLFKAELVDTNGETSNTSDARTDLGRTIHKGKINGYSFNKISEITIFEIHHGGRVSTNPTNWIIESGNRGIGAGLVNALSFSGHGKTMKDENGIYSGGTSDYGLFFR